MNVDESCELALRDAQPFDDCNSLMPCHSSLLHASTAKINLSMIFALAYCHTQRYLYMHQRRAGPAPRGDQGRR